MDVTSLCTNIPQEESITTVCKAYEEFYHKNPLIPTSYLREGLPDSTRHLAGAPNDGFLSNAFKKWLRLSGVLLKLCRLILGCAKKNYLFGYSKGTWVFSNSLGLFSSSSETIRKQQTLNFSYHENSR